MQLHNASAWPFVCTAQSCHCLLCMQMRAKLHALQAQKQGIWALLRTRAPAGPAWPAMIRGSATALVITSEVPSLGLQARKQGIRAQLEDASASRAKLASEVKGMKSSIQYTTPAQIDELVARLEDRQRHGNLSTAEERRTLAEVSSPARSSRSGMTCFSASGGSG